ncbi:MAG: PaaI family thioesterase [Deltaproteobacteria bacterium]|nr:PaaI family thioesterase [Deltaproteobacteria bacterium]
MRVDEELASIPYLVAHGLELVEVVDGRVRVCLRFRPQMEYRPGILHGGSVYTVAEAAAGLTAYHTIAQGADAVMLLRGATVRYLRPARGDMLGSGQLDPNVAAQARASFAQTGKADVMVDVLVTDATATPVMEGGFRYAVRVPRQRATRGGLDDGGH